MMVQDHDNVEDIGADLKRMFYIVAGVCTAFFLLVLVGTLFVFFSVFLVCTYCVLICLVMMNSFSSQTATSTERGTRYTSIRRAGDLLPVNHKDRNQSQLHLALDYVRHQRRCFLRHVYAAQPNCAQTFSGISLCGCVGSVSYRQWRGTF